MNRIGVVKSVADAAIDPLDFTTSELSIVHGDDPVTNDSSHSFLPTSVVDFFVGLKDGSCKKVGGLNPFKFRYSVEQYVAFATGKSIRVGYSGSAGNIVVADPSVSANIGKFGTISVSYTDLKKNTVAPWGSSFEEDVYIVAGDNTAAILAKLVTAATKVVAKLNASFNTAVAVLTSDVASANKYLNIACSKENIRLNVTINGIFEGTLITETVGDYKKGGLLGEDVIDLEKESAVLDGYNPAYVPKQPTFNLDNYVVADPAKGYDIVIVETALPKEYDSPDAPSGWNVSFAFYCETGNSALGSSTTDLVAVLDNIQNIAGGNVLTKAEADDLYAPKV